MRGIIGGLSLRGRNEVDFMVPGGSFYDRFVVLFAMEVLSHAGKIKQRLLRTLQNDAMTPANGKWLTPACRSDCKLCTLNAKQEYGSIVGT